MLWWPVLILVSLFTLIAAHETGHFIAGWLVGIPAANMRVVMTVFPQQVALRDGDEWLSPIKHTERYITVSQRWLFTRRAAFVWVAGGMTLELAATTLACLAARLAGYDGLALWLAFLSLSMYGVNVLFMDLPWALRYGHAVGDTSGLWHIARLPAVVLSLGMLGSRLGLVLWILYAGA